MNVVNLSKNNKALDFYSNNVDKKYYPDEPDYMDDEVNWEIKSGGMTLLGFDSNHTREIVITSFKED